MSAKTKIVVLRMKELIYTGIFAALGILFIVLLIILFLPKKNSDSTKAEQQTDPRENAAEESTDTSSGSIYIPGVYTTELVLNDQTVNVEVIVDQTSVTSIRLVNLSEAVTTMYPLLQPTFDSICKQIYEKQSLDQITYESDNKYTSLVLLEAIKSSLQKAQPAPGNVPDGRTS